ncbi:hypothetical protein PWEIH_08796 [Listeria weihenstephanensis FSL R9-0317]|uniref:Uncharacterized protein n=2 Tax=Listeria weihenstephanensis TaxID=1006155 RepID=A0A1S7FT66_9LIST|nr:hypothetical protein [Listeria weihenstephanensis]AQY50590.1 hypothetical protein UE46_05785 [Listeria weihenstephanensis]EUJ38958.1 hypothetical protein PWEIH_08796 [Listeria weihenstephanensis FSL R9-0317]
MAGEKLIQFYRTKLSNYNLIYSFMTSRIWSFCLTMILLLAVPIAFGLAFEVEGIWSGLAIYAILFLLFYYLFIVRKARKILWKSYHIRNFKKLDQLKLCLLRNYLARNGFSTPEELVVLAKVLEEDDAYRTKNFTIKNIAILLIVLIFAALGAVFILEASPDGHRIFLACLLAVLVVVIAVILRVASYVISHFTDAKKRTIRALSRDIKELGASYIMEQNTSYQPYREMELVIENNDILREIIDGKAIF